MKTSEERMKWLANKRNKNSCAHSSRGFRATLKKQTESPALLCPGLRGFHRSTQVAAAPLRCASPENSVMAPAQNLPPQRGAPHKYFLLCPSCLEVFPFVKKYLSLSMLMPFFVCFLIVLIYPILALKKTTMY